MTKYSTISPQIVYLVKKYSNIVFLKFTNKFELKDLEQEFMVAALCSLKSFDPKKGYITDFLNSCLYKKMIDMTRKLYSNKRSIDFHTIELNEENETINDSKDISIDTTMILSNLPSKLRKIAETLQYTKPKSLQDAVSKNDLFLIRKILKNCFYNKNRSKKLMKNISCIEILSIQELTRLSEEDLYDLSIKVNETLDWIKKIADKLDTALISKYQKEAKASLNNIGIDFGTCNLPKKAFTVNVQIPKKIQWDQKILSLIYDKFDSQMRNNFFKVTFSVGEKEYSEMNENMKRVFDPARTANYGKIKVTIKKNQGK